MTCDQFWTPARNQTQLTVKRCSTLPPHRFLPCTETVFTRCTWKQSQLSFMGCWLIGSFGKCRYAPLCISSSMSLVVVAFLKCPLIGCTVTVSCFNRPLRYLNVAYLTRRPCGENLFLFGSQNQRPLTHFSAFVFSQTPPSPLFSGPLFMSLKWLLKVNSFS